MSINPLSLYSSSIGNYNQLNSAFSSSSGNLANALSAFFSPSGNFSSAYNTAQVYNEGLQNASSFYSVQGSVTETIRDVSSEMQALAIQAQDPFLNDNDRAALDTEFQALKEQVDYFKNFKFNGTDVFGSGLTVSADAFNSLEFDASSFSDIQVDPTASIDTLSNATLAADSLEDTLLNINASLVNSEANISSINNAVDTNIFSAVYLAESESTALANSLPSLISSLNEFQLMSSIQSTVFNYTQDSSNNAVSAILGF
jgi:flagellin-like hook-associated protein FlgL